MNGDANASAKSSWLGSQLIASPPALANAVLLALALGYGRPTLSCPTPFTLGWGRPAVERAQS
jgi:hypothetical protein